MNICAQLSKAIPSNITSHHISMDPKVLGKVSVFLEWVGDAWNLIQHHVSPSNLGAQFPWLSWVHNQGIKCSNSWESWDPTLKHSTLIVSKFCSHNIRKIGSIFLVCRSSCSHANSICTRNAHHIESLLGQAWFITHNNGGLSFWKLINLLKTTKTSSLNAISTTL